MNTFSTCRLCGNSAVLKNSHIVSKFIWRLSGIIGSKKKFDAVCLNKPELTKRNQQDGFKEYLLCADCEELRSKWEGVARQALFANIRGLQFVHNNVTLAGLDYHALKLYSMFQLWMMGVSSLPFYAHVNLGPHADRLAALILAEDPAEPWRYGSTITVLGANEPDLAAVFAQPERIRLYGHNLYRFVVAGLHSFHFVSSHAPSPELQSLFLHHDGTWPVFKRKYHDYPDIVRKIQQMKGK